MSKNINKIQISSSEDDKLQFGNNWLAKKLWRLEHWLREKFYSIGCIIDDHSSALNQIQDKIGTDREKVTTLQGNVTTLQGNVTTLSQKVSTLSGGEDASTKWEKEHQVFIDQWDRAWMNYNTYNPVNAGMVTLSGKYDPAKAPDAKYPFYGGEIWMTYKEALDVMWYSSPICNINSNSRFHNIPCRTLTPMLGDYGQQISAKSMYKNAKNLETLILPGGWIYTDCNSMFSGCYKLRKIFGQIFIQGTKSLNNMFAHCYALEHALIYGLAVDFNLSYSPKLSPNTLKSLVNRALNTSPITVTVHPEVYSKLADDSEELAPYLPANFVRKFTASASNVAIKDSGVEIMRVNQNTSFSINSDSLIFVRKGDKITLQMDVEGLAAGEEFTFKVELINEWASKNNVGEGSISLQNGRCKIVITANNIMDNILNFPVSLSFGENLDTSINTPIKISNVKISYGEHDVLPYTPPLSSISDATLKERVEWASLMQIAGAKQINFATN